MPAVVAPLPRRISWGSALGGLLLVLAGLGWAAAVGATKWHLHAKADRLRAEGIPERATVGDEKHRGLRIRTIQVWYTHRGSTYSAWIPCAGPGGCVDKPPTEMTVWVDPARPEEFLAENGHTDDSMLITNAWGGLPFGLVVAAGGMTIVMVPFRLVTRRLPARPGRRPHRPRRGGRSRLRQRRRTARR